MPPSTLSFLLTRSLSSTRTPHPPISSHHSTTTFFEHINISTIDTPTRSLRSEIVIGFHPSHPHSLLTLSRPTQEGGDCEIGEWEFYPGCCVKLLRRLKVEEQPDYLPVAVASTCFSHVNDEERYYQVIYRSAGGDAEGCIEVRCIYLENMTKSWNVWESVTEEDGSLGGICWNLMNKERGGEGGYMTVATASRVYFFTENLKNGDLGMEYWTYGRRCLIFEVDVFLQRHYPSTQGQQMETRYATRIIHSPSTNNTISILVFVSQKSQLQSFKLEISPGERTVKVCAKRDIVKWKSGARGALLAWSMGRKVMTSHCCEDECGEINIADDGGMSVFKTWFARGEKRSLKELVWEYGGIILDCWDT